MNDDGLRVGQGYFGTPNGLPVILEITKLLVGKMFRFVEYTIHMFDGKEHQGADTRNNFHDVLDNGGYMLISNDNRSDGYDD